MNWNLDLGKSAEYKCDFVQMSCWKFEDSSTGEVIRYSLYWSVLFSALTRWPALQNRDVWSYCWNTGLGTGAIAYLLTTRIGNCFQRGLFFSSELEGSNTITHQPLVFKGERNQAIQTSVQCFDDRWTLLCGNDLVGRIQGRNQSYPKPRLLNDNSLKGRFDVIVLLARYCITSHNISAWTLPNVTWYITYEGWWLNNPRSRDQGIVGFKHPIF